MLPQEVGLNIELSFMRFIYQRLSTKYYVNYTDRSNRELERRLKEKTDPGWWQWIDIHWVTLGQGIFSVSPVQINCNTVREPDHDTQYAGDELGIEVRKMRDEVQDQLNIAEIQILDFSSDPVNPIAVDNVIAARFRGSRALPDAAGDTVNVEALSYDLHVYRESVLP